MKLGLVGAEQVSVGRRPSALNIGRAWFSLRFKGRSPWTPWEGDAVGVINGDTT
jgi:hypothetical protein